MKNFNFTKALGFVLLATLLSCSNNDNPPVPIVTTPPNVGTTNLFAIDTAAVYKMNDNGTNPVKILDKRTNTSSYLYGMSIKPDGTKFVYIESQLSGVVPNLVSSKEIRIANIDGTNDNAVLAAPNSDTSFTFAHYCSDGKIIFVQQEFVGGAVSTNTKVMNEDGSGVTASNISPRVLSVTDGRDFYATDVFSSNQIQIIDTSGDGGGGTVVYSQAYDDSHPATTFTHDAKYCLIAYALGDEIKVDVVDMTTFAATSFTLVSGVGNISYSVYSISMGADNRTGVFTISGDFPKAKSYVFDIVTKVVKAPFEQRNENVSEVEAY